MDQYSIGDEAFEARFLLLGKMEILALLQDLLHRHEAVSAVFNNGRDALLTQLLSVRGEGLVFDRSVDERTNQRLINSERIVFRARPDGVPVNFVCPAPQVVAWDGAEALWVPLPERVVRLQRRETYRVTAPMAKPTQISFESETGETLRAPLHDLSVSGFGVTLARDDRFPEVGTTFPRVSLHLPDNVWLELAGKVCHRTPVDLAAGKPKDRVGIALQAVDRRSDAVLQRLVIRLDQEHHKLSRED